MKQCLIVETRDPVEHRDAEWTAALASGIAARGVPTAILLAENAAAGARAGVAPYLHALLGDGVAISVDRVAMKERGIVEDELVPGLAPADLEMVVDWLEAGATVIWR